jgi:hypothetical protein
MDDLNRRQETAHRQAIRQRNYRRVRDRALARLRKKYPDDYVLLLEEERARDQAEGRAWHSLSGRASHSPAIARYTAPSSTKDRSKQAVSNNGGEGNLEGEE